MKLQFIQLDSLTSINIERNPISTFPDNLSKLPALKYLNVGSGMFSTSEAIQTLRKKMPACYINGQNAKMNGDFEKQVDFLKD